MKITKHELEKLIKEELAKEGVFDRTWTAVKDTVGFRSPCKKVDKKVKYYRRQAAAADGAVLKRDSRAYRFFDRSTTGDGQSPIELIDKAAPFVSRCMKKKTTKDREELAAKAQALIDKAEAAMEKFDKQLGDEREAWRGGRPAREAAAARQKEEQAERARSSRSSSSSGGCRSSADCPPNYDCDTYRGKCWHNDRASVGLEEGSSKRTITKSQLQKLIREALKEKVNERTIQGFDASEFPDPLPADMGKSFMAKGWDDNPRDGDADSEKSDDVVQAGSVSIPAAKLMPSQNAVFLGKALGMSMVPKLSSGGDIKAVISEDNHILDGHHRWAATHIRTKGAADIQGTRIMLPIKQLIPVLRAAGDAYGNQRKGEPGGGDINIFSKEAANPDVIKQMVETGKYMDPKFYNKEKLAAHVESIGGINAIVSAVKNMQALAARAYDGAGLGSAPARPSMPVLEPKQGNVKNVAKRLQKGTIDVAPPYSDLAPGKAALGGEDKEERARRMKKVVSEQQVTRFKRLAKIP